MKKAPTTCDDLSPLMRGALAVWETFRRLGFSADDIYAGAARTLVENEKGGVSEAIGFFVAARADGKEFSVCAGPVDSAFLEETVATVIEETNEEWARSALAVTTMADEHASRIWPESLISQLSVVVIVGLRAKGFILNGPPSLLN